MASEHRAEQSAMYHGKILISDFGVLSKQLTEPSNQNHEEDVPARSCIWWLWTLVNYSNNRC